MNTQLSAVLRSWLSCELWSGSTMTIMTAKISAKRKECSKHV